MHSKKEDTLYLWLNPRSIHYKEIVHSQIIEKDGIKKVIVNFERPTEDGGIQIA